jgi:hypothetical protein
MEMGFGISTYACKDIQNIILLTTLTNMTNDLYDFKTLVNTTLKVVRANYLKWRQSVVRRWSNVWVARIVWKEIKNVVVVITSDDRNAPRVAQMSDVRLVARLSNVPRVAQLSDVPRVAQLSDVPRAAQLSKGRVDVQLSDVWLGAHWSKGQLGVQPSEVLLGAELTKRKTFLMLTDYFVQHILHTINILLKVIKSKIACII